MEDQQSAKQDAQFWVLMPGKAIPEALQSIKAALLTEGLTVERASKTGDALGMDLTDLIVNIGISFATAVGANYLQDKDLTAKIDRSMAVAREKFKEIKAWCTEGPFF